MPRDEKQLSNASGTEIMYQIEMRSCGAPFKWGPGIIDDKWHRIPLQDAPDDLGVPNSKLLPFYDSDTCTYPCAKTLAWWMHSLAMKHHRLVDVRIVEVKIEWQITNTLTGSVEIISGKGVHAGMIEEKDDA